MDGRTDQGKGWAVKQWYVMQVTCGDEITTARALSDWGKSADEAGYEDKACWRRLERLAGDPVCVAYVPIERKPGRSRAKGGGIVRKPVEIAAFPGYVFIQADLGVSETSAPSLTVKAGGRFVRNSAGWPAVVGSAVVARIMALEQAGRFDAVCDVAERLSALIGTSLNLPDGPLQGFPVVVEAITPDGRLSASGSLGAKPFKAVLDVTPEMLGIAA